MPECKLSAWDGEYSPAIGELLHEGRHACERENGQHSEGKLGKIGRVGLRYPGLRIQ